MPFYNVYASLSIAVLLELCVLKINFVAICVAESVAVCGFLISMGRANGLSVLSVSVFFLSQFERIHAKFSLFGVLF